jgi:hypothetical protein
MITLLNDFTEVPFRALCCMASTIFFSNFDAGELFLGESPPIIPPILANVDILYKKFLPEGVYRMRD